MTTADDLASAIAHRRKRAAALMIAQERSAAVATVAAYYAELLTRVAAGATYDDAVTAARTWEDPVLDAAANALHGNPLYVPATARVVEACWAWICGDEPMPAGMRVDPANVEDQLLEIAAFTPATAQLTDASAGVRTPAATGTGTPDAAVIAHRRRRAASLALAHDEPASVAAVAALHADTMTRMEGGLDLEAAMIATGVREDDGYQRFVRVLMEHPLQVISAQYIVETCWDWIRSDLPMPADVNADPATAVPPRDEGKRFVSVTARQQVG